MYFHIMDVKIYSLITLVIGGSIGIASNYISFQREKKYERKNKVRYLLFLLQKAGKQAKQDTNHIKELIDAIKVNGIEIPLLKTTVHSAIDALSDTIVKNDYHTAYNQTFKNLLDKDEYFSKLESTVIFTAGLLKQAREIYTICRQQNYDRMKSFMNNFDIVIDEIEIQLFRGNGGTAELKNAVQNVFDNWQRNKAQFEHLHPLQDYYLNKVTPLMNIDNAHKLPVNIALHLNRCFQIYKENIFQVSKFIENIEQILPTLEKQIDELNELKKNFDNPMVKNLIT